VGNRPDVVSARTQEALDGEAQAAIAAFLKLADQVTRSKHLAQSLQQRQLAPSLDDAGGKSEPEQQREHGERPPPPERVAPVPNPPGKAEDEHGQQKERRQQQRAQSRLGARSEPQRDRSSSIAFRTVGDAPAQKARRSVKSPPQRSTTTRRRSGRETRNSSAGPTS